MPSNESAVVGVNVHAPVAHAAVPFCVLAPAIAIDTVGFTPAAVVHAPPSVVTVAFVMNGNVRAVPLMVPTVTTGAAVLTVIDCTPLEPVFVAASLCVAVTAYVPFAETAGDVVYVHTPAEHGAVPFCVAVPVIATDTVATSPAAVPHAPLTVATVVLVVYGNERTVPFTVVSVTNGAVVSTEIVFAPLFALFDAASVWVAVIEYEPLTISALTNE